MQQVSKRHFLAQVWRLTYPYWRSAEWKSAWGLLIAVIALAVGLVYFSVLLNEWNRDFYNSIQEKDAQAFKDQLIFFCGLAVVYIIMAVYSSYLQSLLQMRWRRWLTEQYFARWLDGRTFYTLELTARDTDNPDQRMAVDLDLFTDYTLSLTLGLMRNILSLVSFSVILWGISGSVELFGITIPAYMFWAALVYAIAGTALTHWIGRRLVPLNNQQQRYEADLRFNLIRTRENAESIALYNGADDERRTLLRRFSFVWDNFIALINQRKRLTWFTSFYGQAAIVFPFVVAAPRYFSGAIQLGELMQISSAFGRVQDGLSWFIDAYTSLAAWKATADRILGFQASIEHAQQETHTLQATASADSALRVSQLQLQLPNGQTLLQAEQLQINPGDTLLVTGESGSGKSTLFRALAGIWPFVHGQLTLPAGARVLFLPQKPYLQIASLRANLCFPAPEDAFAEQRLLQVLEQCRLAHLSGRLNEIEHWAQSLSPGEQQRLAIARALLQQPQWLFLDEATSALDEASEQRMYQLLQEYLPDTTLISIAHRPSVAVFHQRRWHLDGHGQVHESAL